MSNYQDEARRQAAELFVNKIIKSNQDALDAKKPGIRREEFSLKIASILYVRQAFGYGLADAKNFVEKYPRLYDLKTYA